MNETYRDIVSRLESESEIVRKLIHNLRRKGRSRYIPPLWKRVADATQHGSGFGSALCIRYGFDPDEKFMPKDAKIPTGPLV